MSSYIVCYDERGDVIGKYNAPFDVEIDCYDVEVYGDDLSGMKLRGKCNLLVFVDVRDYKSDDLSGFMELEMCTLVVGKEDKGLLKLMELNCKKIWGLDKKLCNIMNKYLEESDPLMRDFEGFKLEMAVNGFGDRL